MQQGKAMLSGWKRKLAAAAVALLFGAPVAASGDNAVEDAAAEGADVFDDEPNSDPFEGFNRAMFNFNDALDRKVLRPVAKGYRAITPDIVEEGITNFFSNLGDLPSAFNNLLQGDINGMFSDLSRVIINTTVGIGGLIDVASINGIEKRSEDLGQTFGAWGIGPGPYLVLPFVGSSSVRDGVGWAGEFFLLDPLVTIDDTATYWSAVALRYVDRRSVYLTASELADQAALDPYIFYRESYFQSRDADVRDGSAADDF